METSCNLAPPCRCRDVTECGSFSSALLCQRCSRSSGRGGPILPLPPLGAPGEEEEDGPKAKWRCGDCGYAVEGDFAASLVARVAEELEAAKCEDPQVNSNCLIDL